MPLRIWLSGYTLPRPLAGLRKLESRGGVYNKGVNLDLPDTRSANGMRCSEKLAVRLACWPLGSPFDWRTVCSGRRCADSVAIPGFVKGGSTDEMTAGFPPARDRERHVRACLSLPTVRVRPAAPMAWPSCELLQAHRSCELSAGATPPRNLSVSVPSTGWLNLGWPLKVSACSPGPAPTLWATQMHLLNNEPNYEGPAHCESSLFNNEGTLANN